MWQGFAISFTRMSPGAARRSLRRVCQSARSTTRDFKTHRGDILRLHEQPPPIPACDPRRAHAEVMADESDKKELFAYYEAQAANYEDFYDGKGQAITALSGEYATDVAGATALLSSFGRGDVVDLACGTGFWLSVYRGNAASITLVDQSEQALAHCERRVQQLGLATVARIVRGDVFDVPLSQSGYDACMLGFLLSHLTPADTDALFARLRTALRPRAELAVIDSVWSDARKLHRQRDGFERRTLADGRSFSIRKKYYDRPELESLLSRHGLTTQSVYSGNVFIAIRAERAR
jgi:demethylmenaquinone methyltransferase/2-methoxy-6-polyprenyl-1,4-benzoquinol methylase